MLHNVYILCKTCLSATQETIGSRLIGYTMFVLVMKYTIWSFVPLFIFHNQHKTWLLEHLDVLFISDFDFLSSLKPLDGHFCLTFCLAYLSKSQQLMSALQLSLYCNTKKRKVSKHLFCVKYEPGVYPNNTALEVAARYISSHRLTSKS